MVENLEEFSRPVFEIRDELEAIGKRLRASYLNKTLSRTQLKGEFETYYREGTTSWALDELDIIVDSFLNINVHPDRSSPRGSDMYGYQPLPARITLEIIRRLDLQNSDTVYDLGSGLGRVAILMGLFSSAKIKGIEFQQSYVEVAANASTTLNLDNTSFQTNDITEVDFTDATVVCMITPVGGESLAKVLEKIRKISLQHRVVVPASGICTADLKEQTWLRKQQGNNREILTIFESWASD